MNEFEQINDWVDEPMQNGNQFEQINDWVDEEVKPQVKLSSKRLEVAKNALNNPSLRKRYIEITGSEPEQDLAGAPTQIKLPNIEQPEKQNTDEIGSFSRGVGQVLTSGVLDEATASLAALYAKYIGGAKQNLGELTNLSQEIQNQQLKADIEQNPVSSIAGNVLGTIITGGAVAGTKAGKALYDSYRNAGTFGKILQGGATGAVSSGLYGAGSAETGKRLEGAKDASLYGGGIGAVIPAAGAIVKGTANTVKGALARSADSLQDIASNKIKQAGAIRGEMKSIGAEFKPEAISKITNNLNEELAKIDLIPEFNPKTIAVVREIERAAESGKLNLDKLDQYRRLLRAAKDEDVVAAGAVRRAMDKAVNSLTPDDFSQGGTEAVNLLNKFRSEYTKASKFEDISEILVKADGDPNKIKAGLTRFMQNTDNTKGWSDIEKDALKNAARTGFGEKLLKMGGKFGIDLGTSTTPGNTVAPIVGSIFGSGAAGMTGAAVVPLAGTVARQGQKYLARGKAEELLRIIENGGKPSIKEINSLPMKDAKKVLEAMRISIPVVIGGNQEKKQMLKINIPK